MYLLSNEQLKWSISNQGTGEQVTPGTPICRSLCFNDGTLIDGCLCEQKGNVFEMIKRTSLPKSFGLISDAGCYQV